MGGLYTRTSGASTEAWNLAVLWSSNQITSSQILVNYKMPALPPPSSMPCSFAVWFFTFFF